MSKSKETVITAKIVKKQVKKLRKMYFKTTEMLDKTPVRLENALPVDNRYTAFHSSFVQTIDTFEELAHSLK